MENKYTPEQTHKVATYLLILKQAWRDLVAATLPLTDLDLSLNYPFGYNDFEQMYTAVDAWCTSNASKLLTENPLMIRNPDCILNCPIWYRSEFSLENRCTNQHVAQCARTPSVPGTRDLLLRAFSCLKYYNKDNNPDYFVPDLNNKTDNELYECYIDLVHKMRQDCIRDLEERDSILFEKNVI